MLPGARRVLVLLIVAWLNLALQPCAMALGADPVPDCPHCPSAQASEDAAQAMHAAADAAMPCATSVGSVGDCDSLDEMRADSRAGELKVKDAPGDQPVALLPAAALVDQWAFAAPAALPVRCNCPAASPPLNVLYCVYLK
jgi:hypothetical protein